MPAASFDVVGLGECSLDEVWVLRERPRWGDKGAATTRTRLGGGQIATAVFAAARLGLRCAFAGAVGDDAAGTEVLAGLREAGIDVDGARIVFGGATRSALILVDGAERTVIEHRDPRVRLDRQRLPDVLDQARIVHLDATDLPAALEAARRARRAGALISLDLDTPQPGLEALIELADVCVTSESFPASFTCEPELEGALRKLPTRPGALVATTLGDRGAAALYEGRLLRAPAYPVDVVDTTACGDTFRAGLLAALLDERPLSDALAFANAAASLKCRDLGRRGCPTRVEVEALLA